ncbi:hypothetical protein J4Q44_G00045220 [Coregonus suidteri]|uniref:Glutaminase EF-hand domain-containing protein n=1 Tax=Coregonus suidteri TaxID=861788 RepID=A0AAN8MJG0_9TELE
MRLDGELRHTLPTPTELGTSPPRAITVHRQRTPKMTPPPAMTPPPSRQLPRREGRQASCPVWRSLLFYTIAGGAEKIQAHKFTTALKATGLRTGDPRLKECMENLKVIMKTTSDGNLDRHLFKKWWSRATSWLLTQAFRKKFVIPDFVSFASENRRAL